MKKKYWYWILALVIAAAVIGGIFIYAVNSRQQEGSFGENLTENSNTVKEDTRKEDGINADQEEQDENKETQTESVMRAMYIPIEGKIHLFAGENGTVFTAYFPEDIYDIDGNKITREELKRGNIVELYGNDIMLESYPAQYPGVSKMIVAEEGKPSDADPYQDIVDEFYHEPDPAEPPTLDIEYRTDLAVVRAMIQRGGYEWTYVDKDGLSNAVVADGAHVLHWTGEGELNDIRLEEPADLVLYFSEEPQEVLVKRWDFDLLGTENIPEGEEIEIRNTKDGIILPAVAGDFIYEITGVWENGRAYYGFLTVS